MPQTPATETHCDADELAPLPGLTHRQTYLVEQMNDLEEVIRHHRERCRFANSDSERAILALGSYRLELRQRELVDALDAEIERGMA